MDDKEKEKKFLEAVRKFSVMGATFPDMQQEMKEQDTFRDKLKKMRTSEEINEWFKNRNSLYIGFGLTIIEDEERDGFVVSFELLSKNTFLGYIDFCLDENRFDWCDILTRYRDILIDEKDPLLSRKTIFSNRRNKKDITPQYIVYDKERTPIDKMIQKVELALREMQLT